MTTKNPRLPSSKLVNTYLVDTRRLLGMVRFIKNIIAAERASLKRASEAANLIYVYGENLSQTTVYRSALLSCTIEMHGELFTLRLNYSNTYLPLPLLSIGLKEYQCDRKYMYN